MTKTSHGNIAAKTLFKDYLRHVKNCPICKNRKSGEPVCKEGFELLKTALTAAGYTGTL